VRCLSRAAAAKDLSALNKPPGQAADPERRERFLGKLGQVWRSLPGWRLAWLVDNLASPGPDASDDELELALDRVLHLDLR
jgi:hypothetical protein